MEVPETARRRGRPRGFEETAMLDAAVEAFWRHGYARTSIGDISAATGVATSSLYHAYGSKLDLFAHAFDRYLDVTIRQFLDPLEFGSSGLADIDAYFENLARSARSGRPGCLAANTIGEMRDAPPLIVDRMRRYRELLRGAFAGTLARAAESGEVPPHVVGPRADALYAIAIASSLLMAAGAPTHDVRQLQEAGRLLAVP